MRHGSYCTAGGGVLCVIVGEPFGSRGARRRNSLQLTSAYHKSHCSCPSHLLIPLAPPAATTRLGTLTPGLAPPSPTLVPSSTVCPTAWHILQSPSSIRSSSTCSSTLTKIPRAGWVKGKGRRAPREERERVRNREGGGVEEREGAGELEEKGDLNSEGESGCSCSVRGDGGDSSEREVGGMLTGYIVWLVLCDVFSTPGSAAAAVKSARTWSEGYTAARRGTPMVSGRLRTSRARSLPQKADTTPREVFVWYTKERTALQRWQ